MQVYFPNKLLINCDKWKLLKTLIEIQPINKIDLSY